MTTRDRYDDGAAAADDDNDAAADDAADDDAAAAADDDSNGDDSDDDDSDDDDSDDDDDNDDAAPTSDVVLVAPYPGGDTEGNHPDPDNTIDQGKRMAKKRRHFEPFTTIMAQARSDLRLAEGELKDLNYRKVKLENKLRELDKKKYKIRWKVEQKEKGLYFAKWCLMLQKTAAIADIDKLRKVSFLPYGYAKPLGETLAKLTVPIPTLTIVRELLLPTHTISTGNDIQAFLEPLVSHLCTSREMRQVYFCEYNRSLRDTFQDSDYAVSLLVQAALENPNIQDVSFSCVIPAVTLSGSLPYKSLEVLTVDLDQLQYSIGDQDVFVTAISKMALLKTFSMTVGYDNDAFAASVLRGLVTGRVPLNELKLTEFGESDDSFFIDGPPALREIAHSTIGLQHLQLPQDINLTGFFSVLNPAASSISSITSITFQQKYVKYHDEFIKRYQSMRNDEFTSALIMAMQARTQPGSLLRELHGLPGDVAVRCVAFEPTLEERLRGETICSLGSQLHTISIKGFSVKCAEAFEEVHKWVRLPCLQLRDIDWEDCERLERCLPELPSIRELHLSRVSNHSCYKAPEILLRMVRQSKNLCVFSITDEDLFSKPELRRLQAYCQRNQFLIQLVENKSWNGESSNESITTVETGLYPFFLRAIRPIQRVNLSDIVATLHHSAGCT